MTREMIRSIEYREILITGILQFQSNVQFTEKDLRKKNIIVLEQIYDTIE